MTKTEPRSAGSGGGRDKTQPTPTELLACPFCGGQVSVTVELIMPDDENQLEDAHSIYLILCCHIALSADTEDEAIAAWNTRVATTLSAREDGWQLVPMIGAMVKADHPTTCLNPDEFFEVIAVEVDSLGARARGENTCWFGISLLTAAPKAPTAGEGQPQRERKWYDEGIPVDESTAINESNKP